MKVKTVGVSPKLLAAVVTAVVTYLVGQEALELPSWAVVAGQALLVAVAAAAVGPGKVEPADPDAGERGQVEPVTLLIYVIVAVILIVILFKVLDRL